MIVHQVKVRGGGEIIRKDTTVWLYCLRLWHTGSPWAEFHQWDGCAGEGHSEEEERLSTPHIRQSPNQRGTHERQQTLKIYLNQMSL